MEPGLVPDNRTVIAPGRWARRQLSRMRTKNHSYPQPYFLGRAEHSRGQKCISNLLPELSTHRMKALSFLWELREVEEGEVCRVFGVKLGYGKVHSLYCWYCLLFGPILKTCRCLPLSGEHRDIDLWHRGQGEVLRSLYRQCKYKCARAFNSKLHELHWLLCELRMRKDQ